METGTKHTWTRSLNSLGSGGQPPCTFVTLSLSRWQQQPNDFILHSLNFIPKTRTTKFDGQWHRINRRAESDKHASTQTNLPMLFCPLT